MKSRMMAKNAQKENVLTAGTGTAIPSANVVASANAARQIEGPHVDNIWLTRTSSGRLESLGQSKCNSKPQNVLSGIISNRDQKESMLHSWDLKNSN